MISPEEKLFKNSIQQIHTIKEGRLDILDQIASDLSKTVRSASKANLVFVCTHNSRRSQIAETSLKSFLDVLGLNEIGVFSCGTEKTGIPKPIIQLFESLGYSSEADGETYVLSQKYRIGSKTYADPGLPANSLAVMVCNQASETCPFVPSFTKRVSLEYHDPKSADGTAEEAGAYLNAWNKISKEMAYLALKLEENIRG